MLIGGKGGRTWQQYQTVIRSEPHEASSCRTIFLKRIQTFLPPVTSASDHEAQLAREAERSEADDAEARLVALI